MDDGWTMPFCCYCAVQPRAVAIFVHGPDVDAGACSLLAMALARTGVLVIIPSVRSGADLIALVGLAERMHPGLPVAVGAHAVACSLVMRALHPLQARVERIFLIAPAWAEQAGRGGPDRWSLLDVVAGRWRPLRDAGLHCGPGQRLLASRLPLFVALAGDDDCSLKQAVASSLHWDRAVATSRTVVTFTDADHATILRRVLLPLVQWLGQWMSAPQFFHAS